MFCTPNSDPQLHINFFSTFFLLLSGLRSVCQQRHGSGKLSFFFFLLFLAWLVSLFVLQVILKFEDANDECLAYREVC